MGITLFYIPNQIDMFVVRLHVVRVFIQIVKNSMISPMKPPPTIKFKLIFQRLSSIAIRTWWIKSTQSRIFDRLFAKTVSWLKRVGTISHRLELLQRHIFFSRNVAGTQRFARKIQTLQKDNFCKLEPFATVRLVNWFTFFPERSFQCNRKIVWFNL